jgi:hypothetical protein
MVKKRSLILLSLALLLGASCRDPIFDKISREVKPREPKIKGVPTKFAVYDDFMYVAASSLHRYGKYQGGNAAGWDHGEWAGPPGRVIDLAATTNYLYALVDYNSPGIWRWKTGMPKWERLGGHGGSPQRIYGETDSEGKPVSGGKVFVGTLMGDPGPNGIDYSIYYADEAESSPETVFKPFPLTERTGLLTGAAFDGGTHFLATTGRGVYAWDGTSSPVQLANTSNADDKNRSLQGIIWTGAKVFAFGRGGDMYKVEPGGFTEILAGSYTLTGALAIWRPEPGAGEGKILLGIKDGSDYGYREVRLNLSTGELILNNEGKVDLHDPGSSPPSTVTDVDLFDTTLRPHPVNHLFQAPYSVDPAMILFAAVQGTGSTTNEIDSGVWSYRNRDGKWQWNAED